MINNEANLQGSVNKMGDNIIDTLASTAKQVFGGASTLIGGVQRSLADSLNIADHSIATGLDTIDTVRSFGVKSTKRVVGFGFDSVKDVGSAVIDGGKEVATGLKGLIPESVKANITNLRQGSQKAPESKQDQLTFCADTKAQLIAQLKEVNEATDRLNAAE